MDTETIRKGLRNIETRAATIDAVVEKGRAMVEAITPLLQDRNEAVCWSAIRLLSDIGDDRAIGPLIDLLEQRRSMADAANALRAITGQDLGEDARTWKEWLMQSPEARQAGGHAFLSDEALVTAATRKLTATLSGSGQEFVVTVSLPDGRSQQVQVSFGLKDTSGHPIVQLTTPCGAADPRRYETALKLNMSIPYGAIALASLEDALCFAMVDSYQRATVHPEDLAESILSLAQHGDSVEKMLTGADTF